MRAFCVLLALASPAAALDAELPSGQKVTLHEVINDRDAPSGHTWRYRFLAPDVAKPGGSVSSDQALADMDALCALVALPDALKAPSLPERVVITLMDRVVPFGQAAPDATQYFEAYRIDNDACAWDEF